MLVGELERPETKLPASQRARASPSGIGRGDAAPGAIELLGAARRASASAAGGR